MDHLPYLIGEVISDRWELLDLLGEGALTTVYRALDRQEEREVAIKVFSPVLFDDPALRAENVARLERALALRHPNLAECFSVEHHGDNVLLVQRLLQGITLEKLIVQRAAKDEVFQLAEVAPLFEQILDALLYLARQGVTSDVHPKRVFILPEMLKLTGYLTLVWPEGMFWPATSYVPMKGVSRHQLSESEVVAGLAVLMVEMLTGARLGSEDDPHEKAPNLPAGLPALYRRALLARSGGYDLAGFRRELIGLSAEATARPLVPPPAPDQFDSVEAEHLNTREESADEVRAAVDGVGSERVTSPSIAMASITPPTAEVVIVTGTSPMLLGITALVIVTIIALGTYLAVQRLGARAEESKIRKPPVPVALSVDALSRVADDVAAPVPDLTRPLTDTATIVFAPPTTLPDATEPQDTAPHPDLIAIADLSTQGTRISASADVTTDASRRPPGVAELKLLRCPGGMRRIVVAPRGAVPARGYCIDVCEFPGCGQRPTTRVTLSGARLACKRRQRRLCTYKEWRRGCGSVYPYGREYDPTRCNTLDSKGAPRLVAISGSYKRCRSAYGLFDMSGNVSEWTDNGWVCGGRSTRDGKETAKCSSHARRSPGSSSGDVGFRCCRDLVAP